MKCDLPDQVLLEVATPAGADRDPAFSAGCCFQCRFAVRKVQVMTSDPLVGTVRRIRMNGKEKVGLFFLIRYLRPTLQRNERVILARINHFGAQAAGDQSSQTLRDVEHKVLFVERPFGPIVPVL